MQRRLAGTNPNWAVRTPMTQTTALLTAATTSLARVSCQSAGWREQSEYRTDNQAGSCGGHLACWAACWVGAPGRKLEQNKWLARYRLRPSSFKASFKVVKPSAGA